MKLLCHCLLGAFLVVAVVESAPRSRSKNYKSSKSSTTYDQKQTGEYNIQLHLKDFQIIAVVGEDSLGALGDYDYEYDYSDFTVKPIGGSNTTTKKPETSSSTDKPPTSTTKKNSHPYPIVSPSTPASASTTLQPSTTQKVEEATQAVENPEKNQPAVEDTQVVQNPDKAVENVDQKETSSAAPNLDKESPSTSLPEALFTSQGLGAEQETSTVKVDVKSPAVALSIPGQIPVFLKDAAAPEQEINLKDFLDKKGAVTNVAIVPSEDLGSEGSEQPALGEILHYKCAHGFAKDKKGRCRRLRRPIPVGITRFASNLAARLRSHGSHSREDLEQ